LIVGGPSTLKQNNKNFTANVVRLIESCSASEAKAKQTTAV